MIKRSVHAEKIIIIMLLGLFLVPYNPPTIHLYISFVLKVNKQKKKKQGKWKAREKINTHTKQEEKNISA